MKNPYVQLMSGGSLHLRVEGTKRTVCGREYARLDYLTVTPEEASSGHYGARCYKCQNKRREGPRTIREAFQPKHFLG